MDIVAAKAQKPSKTASHMLFSFSYLRSRNSKLSRHSDYLKCVNHVNHGIHSSQPVHLCGTNTTCIKIWVSSCQGSNRDLHPPLGPLPDILVHVSWKFEATGSLFVTPARPSLSLEASKGQSLRQSHHPTLPEIYQILATKRSYTVTLSGPLPLASLLLRHPQDAHHPNLWLLRFQTCFSQFLASFFNHDKSQRGKVRLWVSSSIALILNLLTRSGVPTSALEESVLLKVFSLMVEHTGFSCCINLPCQTWSPNSFGKSKIIHSYAQIVQPQLLRHHQRFLAKFPKSVATQNIFNLRESKV